MARTRRSAGRLLRSATASAKKPKPREHETEMDYSLRDAEKVQSAAAEHAAALDDQVGVTAEEIDAHAAVMDRVSTALETHDDQETDVESEAQKRDALLQKAVDGLASIKRRAHLAFSAGRPRAQVDRKALRGFTVGDDLPKTVSAFSAPLRRVERAMKNAAWKKAMGKRRVTAETIKALRDDVAAATKAAKAHGAVRTNKVTTRDTLEVDVAEMRRLTTYLRTAANEAFFRAPEIKKQFDPPPRGRVSPPATPPDDPTK